VKSFSLSDILEIDKNSIISKMKSLNGQYQTVSKSTRSNAGTESDFFLYEELQGQRT